LAQELPALLGAIRFDKSMRWNSSNMAFSRPVRWLLAILGENESCQVIPFSFAGLQSGAATRGLRFRQPAEWTIKSPQQYFESLAQQGILLNLEERKALIKQQIYSLAEQVGGAIADDPALLAEVANLVETPTALRGSFSASHLDLPREVLVSVMKKHQRYFPVINAKDPQSLLPYFIAVRNGDQQWLDVVTQGNEHVIRARFADAAFFVREDIKKPLKDYVPLLSTLTFQVKLGSMLDKSRRITALVEDLHRLLGFSQDELAVAIRAAELCKADLATKMVVEMTSLQGLMGHYYALASGETPAVAQAIFEHYLPRTTGDVSPKSTAGFLVGLADRLDSLAGLFAAGLAPSGNKDPFAQRRSALGIVQNLVAWDVDFDLRQALQAAAQYMPVAVETDSQSAVLEFIIERLRNVLLENGIRYDIVDAVLTAQGHNPAMAARAVVALAGWVSRSDWQTILPAYARCVRITRDLGEKYAVDPSVLVAAEEKELYSAILKAENTPRKPASVDDFLNAFVPMIPVVNHFFDQVLVMADDLAVRKNRLGMLQRIADLAQGVADFSKLEGF
jgi:glycyl-tRNA synthetase